MIRAELSVSSTRISVGSIAERLGAKPDRTRNASDPPRFGSAVSRRENVWARDVSVDALHFGSDEGLSKAIEVLGPEFADRLRRLVDDGCAVTLGIIQEIDDPDSDRLSLGVHLTRGALRWLAQAGADVDLDQYFG